MPASRRWVYDPHRGGKAIPDAVRRRTEERLRRHAESHFAGRYRELDVRFRGKFCYVAIYRDDDLGPLNLCRLRFLGNEDGWSFALYIYASEAYEPSIYPSGKALGRPEDAFELAARFRLD